MKPILAVLFGVVGSIPFGLFVLGFLLLALYFELLRLLKFINRVSFSISFLGYTATFSKQNSTEVQS